MHFSPNHQTNNIYRHLNSFGKRFKQHKAL